MTDVPEIPEQIRELMNDEEIENMRNLDGWAYGKIVERRTDGREVHVIEYGPAWIELFNGEGHAGRFSGVRFMAVWDGEYEETYAYSGPAEADENEPCYLVADWISPEDPDVGPKCSDRQEVAR